MFSKKFIRQICTRSLNAMSGKCVFILGCQRSGTTLLYMMMTSHPSITGKNEDEAAYRLPRIKPLFWNCMRFKHTCYKLPTKASDPDFILKRFPAATILWLIRHPYSVISSMRSLIMNAVGENWLKVSAMSELERLTRLFPEIPSLNVCPDDEIALGATVWKYKMLALEKFRTYGLTPHIVKYEDLLTRPKETLSPMLSRLGLPWSDRILAHEIRHAKKVYCGNNIGSKPLDPSKINSPIFLNQDETSVINRVCGDLIGQYYGR